MIVYLLNYTINTLLEKYDKDKINLKFLEKTYDEKRYEMLQIKINCNIDEMKDIFFNIKPKRIIKEKLIINYYIDKHNDNDELFKMVKLFDLTIDYNLNIEIYKKDFEPFDVSEIDDGIYIDISDINFLS